MEIQKIKEFVSTPVTYIYRGIDRYGDEDGYGYGYGSGYGEGDGTGDGYGDGNGYGYGDGDGAGAGHGCGYGDGDGYGSGNGKGYVKGDGDEFFSVSTSISGNGIKSINGRCVYNIDGILTLITSVKGNIASGFILEPDLSLSPCYVAKEGNIFAHGKTVRMAVDSLRTKIYSLKQIPERIADFKKKFVKKIKYKTSEFYKWHTILTGSCELGKETFVKENNIDLKGKMTVDEFINLTKDSYGKEIILQLKEK